MSIYIEKNKKTKALIQQAFVGLLAEKPFESLTIADISNCAGINRGTFYLHYRDKFDLLEKMEQQLISELGEHLDKLQSGYSPLRSFEGQQAEMASALFGFISAHSSTLKVFFGGNVRADFHFKFRDAFCEKVRGNLEKTEGFADCLDVPLDYFLLFITSAFLGLVEQWAMDGFDRAPAEMTKTYINIISFIQQKRP